jgi:hypothetical protein
MQDVIKFLVTKHLLSKAFFVILNYHNSTAQSDTCIDNFGYTSWLRLNQEADIKFF